MRFSDRITLYTETEGGYDPSTGKHEDYKITDKTLPCKLSQLGIQRTNELFGTIDTHIVVARLQNPYKKKKTSAKNYSGMFKREYVIKRQSDKRKPVILLDGAYKRNLKLKAQDR